MTPDNQAQSVEELVARLNATNALLQQEIAARRQAEAEIVQREANLLTLQYIGATTAASQDISFALNTLAHEITSLLGVEACTIFDWDQTANQLVAVAELGRSNGGNEASLAPAQAAADHPLIQRILTKGRAQQFTLSQPEIDPAGLAYLQAARLKTLLMLPMETQGHTIGIVEIKDQRIERTFSNQEVALVQLLANQAAGAMENAQLYAQTQQELAARELMAIERKKSEQALREVEASLVERETRLLAEMQSVLVITRALVTEVNLNHLMDLIITQAEHLTNADGVAVLLLKEDGLDLEVATISKADLQAKVGSQLPLKGSLVEVAITSHQVQIRNDALNDERIAPIQSFLQPDRVQSLLCAPLVMQNEDLGALLIWSRREQIFTEYESRLMSLFADQAALALNNARLHARNRQLAVQQERHRLARGLHDSVTQSLYSIGLAAQTSLRLLDKEATSQVREPIGYIHSLSQTALTEMREQLYHLHPTVLNEDLVEALTQHCQILHKQYALLIDFQANLPILLSIQQRDALYYIAREALWNIVRHAQATQARLVLAKEYDQMMLTIEDNGIGFDTSIFGPGDTMGLRNMAERAKMLGGTLEVQSTVGQGTRLILHAPL